MRRTRLTLSTLLAAAALVLAGASAEAKGPAEKPPGAHGAAGHGKAHGHDKAHGHGATKGPGAHKGHGAHGHGHKEPPINWTSFDYKKRKDGAKPKWLNPPLLFAFINFAILLYLLVRFAGKPLSAYLAERHTQIKKDLAEAARLRDEAEAKLSKVDEKLSGLDAEIAEIKASVQADAEAEKKRIIEHAEAEAEALVAGAERTLDIEIERAKRKLEVSAVQAALQSAEKLLKREVNDADVTRLREEYLAQISSGSEASTGGGN
jgi:F-type H+-transporting ATPase subunit b